MLGKDKTDWSIWEKGYRRPLNELEKLEIKTGLQTFTELSAFEKLRKEKIRCEKQLVEANFNLMKLSYEAKTLALTQFEKLQEEAEEFRIFYYNKLKEEDRKFPKSIYE